MRICFPERALPWDHKGGAAPKPRVEPEKRKEEGVRLCRVSPYATTSAQPGGTYHCEGDYLIPDLAPPDEDEQPIGIWGQRHERYVEQEHRALYHNLMFTGKLHKLLAEVDERALDKMDGQMSIFISGRKKRLTVNQPIFI